MAEELKYCEDCRFCWVDEGLSRGSALRFAKCRAPMESELVSREVTDRYCSTARAFTCGREAVYFEPRDPNVPLIPLTWWQRLWTSLRRGT